MHFFRFRSDDGFSPSIFASSFALADIDALRPGGGLYDRADSREMQPHKIQKRGGTMGYGGVYNLGGGAGGSDYHAGVGGHEDYEGRDYQAQYDYYDDYGEGRTSGANYLQGYDYNTNPYQYHYEGGNVGGRQGGSGGYGDYQDFNGYDPHAYYSNAHNSRDGQAFNNYGYKDANHYENFYYKK